MLDFLLCTPFHVAIHPAKSNVFVYAFSIILLTLRHFISRQIFVSLPT